MGFFNRMIDYLTLGSARPLRRLAVYYIVLGVVTAAMVYFFPVAARLFSGEKLDALARATQVLQDGLTGGGTPVGADILSRLQYATITLLVFAGTIALMLPVSWVYMSTREGGVHNQSVVQTLIVLPIVVAGIVLIVRDSLALAFSLAGVVAAVRFRTSLSDARDVVYIFLAIAVGFAAGVHVLTIAILLSMMFNLILVFIWKYDFGKNLLEPSAADHWAEPLATLATNGDNGKGVPDRDLVLALTPEKVDVLAERFNRVKLLLGSNGKKPKYNAIVTITTERVGEAQLHVEQVLTEKTKRWKLDEAITNTTKPSELYYLVKMKKAMHRDELVTAIRVAGGESISDTFVEVGEAIAVENGEKRARRKKLEHQA